MTPKAPKPFENALPEAPKEHLGQPGSKVGDRNRVSKVELESRWRTEHADAIRAENNYIENHGLPLAKYGHIDIL